MRNTKLVALSCRSRQIVLAPLLNYKYNISNILRAVVDAMKSEKKTRNFVDRYVLTLAGVLIIINVWCHTWK